MDKFNLKKFIAEGKLLKEEKIDRKTFNAAAIEAIQQLSTDVIKTKSQFNKLKRELHRIYDDGDINTREDIDDNIEFILGNHIVRQKVLGENKSLKEGLFDSSKKKIINWLDQNATKNTDRDIDYDYELEGGEQVKIANGGVMVDIESGISKKLSFSEFKKYFINENKSLKEDKINTNVYYVEEYNDFNQEAVPEYEIDDVEAMLSSNEKNHLYIKKGTKGHYEDGIFTTEEESDTRVKPEYVTEGKLIKENSVDLDSDIKDGIKNFIYGEEFLIRLLNLVPEEYGDITFDDPLMQDLKPHLDELIEIIANKGVEIQNHISKTY